MDVNEKYLPMAKKIGRPTLEPSGSLQKVQLQATVSKEYLAKIDEWRRNQPDLPSRSEAIRRMIDLALKPRQNDSGKKR